MGKKDIIRVRDRVRIMTPEVVYRVGYPAEPAMYQQAMDIKGREKIRRLMLELCGYAHRRVLDKVVRDFAYTVMVKDRFGGCERSVHTSLRNDLVGREGEVVGRRVVQVGTYLPGYGEDEPNVLHGHPVVLFTIDLGVWSEVEIQKQHLVKVPV